MAAHIRAIDRASSKLIKLSRPRIGIHRCSWCGNEQQFHTHLSGSYAGRFNYCRQCGHHLTRPRECCECVLCRALGAPQVIALSGWSRHVRLVNRGRHQVPELVLNKLLLAGELGLLGLAVYLAYLAGAQL